MEAAPPDEEAGGEEEEVVEAVSPATAEANAALLGQMRELPNKISGVFRQLQTAAALASNVIQYLLILFLLFIVHQIFIWFDREPEAAFDQAAQALEIAEIVWDFNGRTINMYVDILNAGVIPLWNSVSYYWAEPFIALIIEIFYEAFAARDKNGKYTPYAESSWVFDPDVGFAQPYIDCVNEAYSAEWCGRCARTHLPRTRPTRSAQPIHRTRYAYYAERLESVDKAEGYVDQSDQYRMRALRGIPNERYLFDVATARRLAQIAPEGEFITPSFDLDGIEESIGDFTSLGITIGATGSDAGFAVFYEGFKQGFSVVFDAVLKIIKTLLETLKMLIKSGMLTVLLNIGIDATIIYYTEIYIPLLFAAIDAVMCLVNLFQPDTWTEQLQCAAARCFDGAEAESVFYVFTSVPVLLKRAAAIADAAVNSKTMKGFVNNKKVSTRGRVWDPVNQTYIVTEEPEGAENPRPQFSPFLDLTGFAHGGPEMDACRRCFACKVPELRAIWWLFAYTSSSVSPSSIMKFAGNVSQECQNNQTGYLAMCGDPGTELLPVQAWRSLKERSYGTIGYDPIDPRIPDTFAAAMMDRARQSGDVDFLAAAEAWERRDKGAPPGEQGIAFQHQMCRILRGTQMHAEHGDGGPMFADYAEDSKSYIVGKYHYTNCKRFKHIVVGDIARTFHDGLFEVVTCIGNDVACHKQMRECLGGCGGSDGSNLKHDFHTQVSIADLGEDTLGELGFSQAAANCTIKTAMVDIPLFEGGDSFKTFAARLRVRSKLHNSNTRNLPRVARHSKRMAKSHEAEAAALVTASCLCFRCSLWHLVEKGSAPTSSV